MQLTSRCNGLHRSLTRQLFEMASSYTDIINLTLGDPDLSVSPVAITAAADAMKAGKTHYSTNAGIIELRKKLSEKLEAEYGLHYAPEDEITVTLGGMEGLFMALMCLVEKGDEVLMPSPYYPNYIAMVNLVGGTSVTVPMDPENGFKINGKKLVSGITDKTRVIILNTPGNPTGQICDMEDLKIIAEAAIKHDIVVIGDDVYRTLIYDGLEHASIATLPGMKERTMLINSFSKEYSMTGLRVGYAAGNKEIINCMTLMQENIASCAATPLQYASLALLNDAAQFSKDMKTIFESRRNVLCAELEKIPGLRFVKPQATFYVFIDVSSYGLKSLDFAKRLLMEKHVAVAPGLSYGKEYDGYIRIAFTLKEEKLVEAAQRIGEFVKTL